MFMPKAEALRMMHFDLMEWTNRMCWNDFARDVQRRVGNVCLYILQAKRGCMGHNALHHAEGLIQQSSRSMLNIISVDKPLHSSTFTGALNHC